MNTFIKTTLFTSLVILSINSLANESNIYIGVKALQMDFSEKVKHYNGKVDVDSGNGIALIGGYKINGAFSIEVFYQNAEGETEDIYHGIGTKPGEPTIPGYYKSYDVEVDTFGSYITYQSAGDFYIQGKAGAFYEDISIGNYNHDDTGVIAGAGVGYKFNSFKIQLDYDYYSSDKSAVGLGLYYNF